MLPSILTLSQWFWTRTLTFICAIGLENYLEIQYEMKLLLKLVEMNAWTKIMTIIHLTLTTRWTPVNYLVNQMTYFLVTTLKSWTITGAPRMQLKILFLTKCIKLKSLKLMTLLSTCSVRFVKMQLVKKLLKLTAVVYQNYWKKKYW